MKTRICLFAFLLACSFAALPQTQGAAVEELVAIQAGELPIVISAPHGGTHEIPGVPARVGEGLEKGSKGYFTGRDTGTEELAREVAAQIERRFQKKPYFVISRTHRQYLDPNRPPEIAYEDDDAKPVYARYHDSLATYCREIQSRFHAGLLLDIHGQGSKADTVFRGTKNGLTVQLLRQRYGEGAHIGAESFFGLLDDRGWKVFPNPFNGQEQAGFTGGFIVQTYGSHQAGGIDAIQLEFGADYRAKASREKTASTLTDAVAAYGRQYLSLAAPDQIQVGVFVGEGTSVSKANVLDVLRKNPKLAIHELDADDIRQGKLKEYRVLIHPGGSGSKQGQALGEEGRVKVRDFVYSGGGYVGVCAGAYLATCDYDWSLNILDAKVVDRAHWARGTGDVEIALSPQGRSLLGTDSRTTIYYHQGPLLAPANNPDIADYDTLAVFEGEIAKNGAPKGVMPGTTAIASGPHGKGRVICFSPHPEKTPGLEELLTRAVLWSSQQNPPNPTR